MGNSYTVFLLSVGIEAGRGDHLVQNYVNNIISEYLKERFDDGALIRRPYVVKHPKVKVRKLYNYQFEYWSTGSFLVS